VRSIVVDPKTYPPFLKGLEQGMYDAILRYRRKKRCVSADVIRASLKCLWHAFAIWRLCDVGCSWVASHDPVGVEDRQITLLESLSVNMEQVRAAVTAVNELLAAEQGNFGPRPGSCPSMFLSSNGRPSFLA
jgi:hypothetical protein